MTPQRSRAISSPGSSPSLEDARDTIPAPPPSDLSVESSAATESGAPASRVASRRRDTVPAPADVPAFDEEPATDPTPQLDAV